MKIIAADSKTLDKMEFGVYWDELVENTENDLTRSVITKLHQENLFFDKPITFHKSITRVYDSHGFCDYVVRVEAKVDDEKVPYEYKYEYPKVEDLENPRHPFWY